MAEHTPGPWEYWDSYDGKGESPVEPCRHCGRTDTAHFTIPGGHGDGECPVYLKADARLIAAAPELLAALERLLENHPECYYTGTFPEVCVATFGPEPPPCRACRARAAIGKAQGG